MDHFNRNELAIELRCIKGELGDVLDGSRYLGLRRTAERVRKAIEEVNGALDALLAESGKR